VLFRSSECWCRRAYVGIIRTVASCECASRCLLDYDGHPLYPCVQCFLYFVVRNDLKWWLNFGEWLLLVVLADRCTITEIQLWCTLSLFFIPQLDNSLGQTCFHWCPSCTSLRASTKFNQSRNLSLEQSFFSFLPSSVRYRSISTDMTNSDFSSCDQQHVTKY